MQMNDSGWVTAEKYNVYDKHWNPIMDVVSYNPETGDVRRKTTMPNRLEDMPQEEGVIIMRYSTPFHLLLKA